MNESTIKSLAASLPTGLDVCFNKNSAKSEWIFADPRKQFSLDIRSDHPAICCKAVLEAIHLQQGLTPREVGEPTTSDVLKNPVFQSDKVIWVDNAGGIHHGTLAAPCFPSDVEAAITEAGQSNPQQVNVLNIRDDNASIFMKAYASATTGFLGKIDDVIAHIELTRRKAIDSIASAKHEENDDYANAITTVVDTSLALGTALEARKDIDIFLLRTEATEVNVFGSSFMVHWANGKSISSENLDELSKDLRVITKHNLINRNNSIMDSMSAEAAMDRINRTTHASDQDVEIAKPADRQMGLGF